MLPNRLSLKRTQLVSCEDSAVDGEGNLIHWRFGETRACGITAGRSPAKAAMGRRLLSAAQI